LSSFKFTSSFVFSTVILPSILSPCASFLPLHVLPLLVFLLTSIILYYSLPLCIFTRLFCLILLLLPRLRHSFHFFTHSASVFYFPSPPCSAELCCSNWKGWDPRTGSKLSEQISQNWFCKLTDTCFSTRVRYMQNDVSYGKLWRKQESHRICHLPPNAVAQLVEALRYKPEGCGFDSRWGRCFKPSGCPVALGATQPLTGMSARNISWGVKAAGA
jgi:hypothetical protein